MADEPETTSAASACGSVSAARIEPPPGAEARIDRGWFVARAALAVAPQPKSAVARAGGGVLLFVAGMGLGSRATEPLTTVGSCRLRTPPVRGRLDG